MLKKRLSVTIASAMLIAAFTTGCGDSAPAYPQGYPVNQPTVVQTQAQTKVAYKTSEPTTAKATQAQTKSTTQTQTKATQTQAKTTTATKAAQTQAKTVYNISFVGYQLNDVYDMFKARGWSNYLVYESGDPSNKGIQIKSGWVIDRQYRGTDGKLHVVCLPNKGAAEAIFSAITNTYRNYKEEIQSAKEILEAYNTFSDFIDNFR